MIVVEARNLTKIYRSRGNSAPENIVRAVDHVNLNIEKGEYVAICGQSGAGKSTLMHLLGGLEQPDSGEVLIEGVSLSELDERQKTVFRRKKIGFVFQSFHLLPYLSVWENVILPVSLDDRTADEEFVGELLETLGLTEKRENRPEELSGGQRQRVAIARALVTRPAILIADEPTGNLDSLSGDHVMNLLRKSCTLYGQTLLVVTHNEQIAKNADRIIRIKDGSIE